MNAEEADRLELDLELRQRDGREVAVRRSVEVAVVVLGHDVQDVVDRDEQLLAGLLDGNALNLGGRLLGSGLEAADRLPQPIDLDRLDQVVGRFDLEGLHRVLAVRRDEDD